jgi:hypothetical protein
MLLSPPRGLAGGNAGQAPAPPPPPPPPELEAEPGPRKGFIPSPIDDRALVPDEAADAEDTGTASEASVPCPPIPIPTPNRSSSVSLPSLSIE